MSPLHEPPVLPAPVQLRLVSPTGQPRIVGEGPPPVPPFRSPWTTWVTRRWVSRIEWARYSRPGIASSAKLTVNLMLFSGVATPAEAITVARAGGLGNEEIRDLLAESPVVAPGIRNRFQAVLDASGPTWWTTELGAKDARLATELVQAAGCISVRSSETRTRRPPMPASATTTSPTSPGCTADDGRDRRPPGTERGSAGPTDAPTHQVLHFYPTADNVHYVKLERNSRDGVRRTVARALPPGHANRRGPSTGSREFRDAPARIVSRR